MKPARFRMVPTELCEKIMSIAPAMRELGADYAANLMEEIGLARECPLPSFPDSVFLLDRLRDKMINWREEITDGCMELERIADKTNKEGEARP